MSSIVVENFKGGLQGGDNKSTKVTSASKNTSRTAIKRLEERVTNNFKTIQ